MADIEVPKREEIDVKGEFVTEVLPETTHPEPTPEEQHAAEGGWVPKDQWKGDPEAWRPAKEFNERGELFAKIRQQSKDIQELRSATSFLTEQHKKQYVKGYQDAIVSLKEQRNAALENGDLVVAQKITDKIDDTKEQMRATAAKPIIPQAAPQPTETFFSWADRNNWYTKDKVMTHFADAIGLAFKEDNPNSTERDMLSHVEKEVKSKFAEKFPGQQVKSPPSPDGDGRGGSRTQGKSGYSSVESAMPQDHKDLMRTIIKATGMTKDEYLKQYAGA